MDKERLFRYLDRKYSSKSEIIPNIPLGEDADAIWAEILQNRRSRGITLPLSNADGDSYWYILTNNMISASEVIIDELMEQDTVSEPQKSSLLTIEEIYYTGFMEGAQISIQDAMEFLQSGAEPSNAEELILMNSRQAAGFAAENMYHAIDSDFLHNLAYFLTEGLDNGGGNYRITDSIDIPSLQGEIVRLPPAHIIPEQTERFACFLADTGMHPLIKAATAQAWILAYRPFPEGNERLARLLSNVILIRAGYSFFGNISISSVLARTSYDYFRAIANILRIENGADLTYFLECYLVTLSSAVNELKERRKQQVEKVVEAEQQLAVMPLEASESPPALKARKQSYGNPCIQAKHLEYERKLDAALHDLQDQGYVQFTLGDLEKLTGIKRNQVRKLLLPYEESERIFAVRKSRIGNIYSFKRILPPDEASDAIECHAQTDFESDQRAYVISALKKRTEVGSKTAKDVAGELLRYIQAEKYRFNTFEVAQNLDITFGSARNAIRYYYKHKMIRLADNRNHFQIYEFCFAPIGTGDDVVTDYASYTGTIESFLEMIRDKGVGRHQIAVAEILLDYLHKGRRDFSSYDVAEGLQIPYQMAYKHLKTLEENHVLVVSKVESHIKFFRFSEIIPIDHGHELSCENYSDTILEAITMLENSENSQKDRRIAKIIRKCLPRGIVTVQDYALEGESTKWKRDMLFATQLGLVKKISNSEYRIMTYMDATFTNLRTSQKSTLSALYEIFGDGMFSVEMAVAQLDYSSAHMSGILHQFTMLKLLDCTSNDDKTYSYQLNVNPTDNPECFVEAA